MPHDAPSALEVLTADYLATLDAVGTYTPVLTATTTNPNLGADGASVGFWHRNGHRIMFKVRFLAAGTGVTTGSGVYDFNAPFPPDTGFEELSSTNEAGSKVGHGRFAGATAGDRRIVSGQFWHADGLLRLWWDGSSVAWGSTNLAIGTGAGQINRLSFVGEYLADPASLP